MKVLISASDPGGAFAILPVVKKLFRSARLTIVLGGKARQVFRDAKVRFKDGERMTRDNLVSFIQRAKPDIFLSGTSFGPTLDKKLLLLCRKSKIPAVYVLDFWSNYWQRFSTAKIDFKFLPDYVCVMDERARREIIREGFPARHIIVTGNPYFEHFLKLKITKPDKNKILFLSQPLAELKRHQQIKSYGYDEFKALQDLQQVLKSYPKAKLYVRLHPRESSGKFKDSHVRYDPHKKIEDSINYYGLLVGMNSAALFEAALAGAQVVSYQPGLRVPDALPSNRLGLSLLVKTKKDLRTTLGKYFSGYKLPTGAAKKQRAIIRHATENVLEFILALCQKKKS